MRNSATHPSSNTLKSAQKINIKKIVSTDPIAPFKTNWVGFRAFNQSPCIIACQVNSNTLKKIKSASIKCIEVNIQNPLKSFKDALLRLFFPKFIQNIQLKYLRINNFNFYY